MEVFHYKLRVTLEDYTSEQVQDWVKTSAVQWALALEGGGEVKPHVHLYVVSELKTATLRARLKKVFPKVFGNSGRYSLGELNRFEGDYCMKYMAYICKESTPVVSGIPEEVLKEAAELAKDFQKTQKSSQDSKQVLEDLVHMTAEYIDKGMNDGNVVHTQMDIRQYGWIIIEYHRIHDKAVRNHQFHFYLNYLIMKFEGTQALLSHLLRF